MNTVLFVNATIVSSENLFLVSLLPIFRYRVYMSDELTYLILTPC